MKLSELHADLKMQERDEFAWKKLKAEGLDEDGEKQAKLTRSLSGTFLSYSVWRGGDAVSGLRPWLLTRCVAGGERGALLQPVRWLTSEERPPRPQLLLFVRLLADRRENRGRGVWSSSAQWLRPLQLRGLGGSESGATRLPVLTWRDRRDVPRVWKLMAKQTSDHL